MNEITVVTESQLTDSYDVPFEDFVDAALSTVAKSSQQTYGRTYRQWCDWCAENGADPRLVLPKSIVEFLRNQSVTRSTRQRQFSAMRKLARVMATLSTDTRFKQIYEALLLIKVPTDDLGGQERVRRALDTHAVWRVLEAWKGDTLVQLRNRALLAVMFYTGMRRAEITELRWEDIDFEYGTITVRHGKGDKRREAAVVADSRNTAIVALRLWQAAQSEAAKAVREFVFCAVEKGGKLGADRPITARAVNQIVALSSERSEVLFTPHDARRTLGTDLLAQNNPLADVQAQLGHAHPSTTLEGYAMPADARKRRTGFKTSY